MPDILIDRELLQRILDRCFELDIDNRAHRAMVSRASAKNPGMAAQYAAFVTEEIAVQQNSFEGTRRILLDSLASGDDAAFRRTLVGLFPPR
jgi:hypothetical protein